MRRTCCLLAACVTAILLAACDDNDPLTTPPASGTGELTTLVDVTTGLDVTGGETGTFNYVGQSFVVPQTGNFNNLRFHWYSFQRTPVAFGNLFLLSQEYLGRPSALASSLTGFVGRSETLTDGVYRFPADVTITGGTRYWVYTDTQGSMAGSFDQDIYNGGDMYVTGINSIPFRKAQASGRIVNGVFVPAPPGVFVDANFKLQATVR
jgi:hypothetical protein